MTFLLAFQLTGQSKTSHVEIKNTCACRVFDWVRRMETQQQAVKKFVIPPNSNTFSDWKKTCHVPWVKTNKTHHLSWETTSTFDSHVIRSFFLKPRQVYQPAGVRQTISSQLFNSFELEGITRHLMTGPAGNSEFCFPSEALEKTKLTVSLRASRQVLNVKSHRVVT